MSNSLQDGQGVVSRGGDKPWRWLASGAAGSSILERAESLLGGGGGRSSLGRSKIREVAWVELPGLEPVVLKRYLPMGLGKALWMRLRGSQWRREWRISQRLGEMGVLAPRPLLLGERLCRGVPVEGILVSQAIQDARSLTQEMQAAGPSRPPLLKDLGEYLARIHALGILHLDLHGDNVLVGRAGQGGPVFWLLDLHRVRVGRRLSKAERRWNLAQILLSMRRELCPGEDRVLLEAYLKASGLEAPSGSWLDSIGRTQRRMLRKHQRSRTRRCLKDSSGFAVEVIPGGRVIRRREFPMEAVLRVMEQANQALDSSDPRVLKVSGPTRITRCTVEVGGLPTDLCIKEHGSSRPMGSLLGLLVPSRARRFWVGAWGMIVRGFSVPAPMAIWETTRRGALCSGVVMEMVEEGVRLDRFLASTCSDVHGMRQLMKALASTLARMHAHGIFHRDLKATNVMVRPTGRGDEILFLDLEDVSFCRKVARPKVALNLAQLDASMPECVGRLSRLRFLRMYLGKGCSRESLRRLSREVGWLSQKRRAGG